MCISASLHTCEYDYSSLVSSWINRKPAWVLVLEDSSILVRSRPPTRSKGSQSSSCFVTSHECLNRYLHKTATQKHEYGHAMVATRTVQIGGSLDALTRGDAAANSFRPVAHRAFNIHASGAWAVRNNTKQCLGTRTQRRKIIIMHARNPASQRDRYLPFCSRKHTDASPRSGAGHRTRRHTCPCPDTHISQHGVVVTREKLGLPLWFSPLPPPPPYLP